MDGRKLLTGFLAEDPGTRFLGVCLFSFGAWALELTLQCWEPHGARDEIGALCTKVHSNLVICHSAPGSFFPLKNMFSFSLFLLNSFFWDQSNDTEARHLPRKR